METIIIAIVVIFALFEISKKKSAPKKEWKDKKGKDPEGKGEK